MRDEPLHVEESYGVTIKVYLDHDIDPDHANPRNCTGNLGKMVCWHRNYDLGDEHEFSDPQEFIAWYKRSKRSVLAILPLYLIDHSGISMSTGSFAHIDPGEWDSGIVGFIYVTKAMARKEGVPKDHDLRADLEAEVEVYDAYLQGNVMGYVVEGKDGEVLDSRWGFLETTHRVEDTYCLAEARSFLEHMHGKGLEFWAERMPQFEVELAMEAP